MITENLQKLYQQHTGAFDDFISQSSGMLLIEFL